MLRKTRTHRAAGMRNRASNSVVIPGRRRSGEPEIHIHRENKEGVLLRGTRAWPFGPSRNDNMGEPYRIGGAYWMPPAFQSWFSPRGMCSFNSAPTLRS